LSTSYTPGPWTVAYRDTNGQAVVKAEHIEVATCWHHCVGAIEKEMEVNARLIAAAPDLLAALESVIEACEGYVPNTSKQVWADAYLAIAKATGSAS